MKKIFKKASEDTYSYKGWLVSDKFHKRAFAVLGHNIVGMLMIYGIIAVIAILYWVIATAIEFLSK